MWRKRATESDNRVPESVREVVKRLVRIESKLHVLAKALHVDLNAQLDQEAHESWTQPSALEGRDG